MQRITTFLMFEGNAKEAMDFYISLFDNARIKDITYHASELPEKQDLVMKATFELEGQEFMCIDSIIKHQFTFTPSMSLFINCKNEGEINLLFAKLSENGQVMMALDKYPFSKKFAWLADRFGVSWQLNLPN